MTSFASLVARAVAATSFSLVVLAWTRLGPVYAQPPVSVRALPLVPWLFASAVMAALTARREPAPRGGRAITLALIGALLGLAVVVALRGPVGLSAQMETASGEHRRLAAGPVDATPTDLGEAKGLVAWEGRVVFPQSGSYRLWVEGRGRVELRLDGNLVLAAQDEVLDAGADRVVGRGEHTLSLRYEKTGDPEMRTARIRGHRLRLGWVRPWRDGSPGHDREWIPPRYLGAPAAGALWLAIDALSVASALLAGLFAFFLRWERPSRGASSMGSRREWSLSAAGYAVILGVMSWPMLGDLAGRGIVDRPDGELSVWIMAWDAHTFFSHPFRLFDAPVFYPAAQALAFSENMLLPAVLAAPFTHAGGAVLGYNVVFLLAALGSGLGVQLLVRRACGDGLAAFVAGALFAAGAHRWARIVHMHEQFTPLLPLIFWALDRFWQRRTLSRALTLGTLIALQGMASIYLGVIVSTIVGLLIVLAWLAGLRLAELGRLALGILAAGLLLGPLLRPYFAMRERYGAEWSLEAVEPHALTLPSYLASGTRLYSAFTERHMDPDLRRRPLFPGLVPLGLGIAGLAGAPRRYRSAALVAALAAVALSLGPESAFYRWMYESVVFFRGLRGVFRFAVIPMLMLCALSAFALAGRRRLAVAALALGLLEASQAPLKLGDYEGPSDVARWLAGKPGATVFLPLGEAEDARAMRDTIPYFPPLLNGYSSFTPPHRRWLPDLLETPLSPDALRLLRALDVRYVVTRDPLELPRLASPGGTVVYAVPAGEAARAVACPGPGVPALWSPRDVTLDLGAERSLRRILFEVGEGVPERAPRVSVSSDGASFHDVGASLDSAGAVLALAATPRAACAQVSLAATVSARFVRVRDVPLRPGGRVAAD